MKIILECTIPESDVAIAKQNGPGDVYELDEWIVNHLNAETRSYFKDDLGFEFTIKVLDSY